MLFTLCTLFNLGDIVQQPWEQFAFIKSSISDRINSKE